jgi:hypothetical protein
MQTFAEDKGRETLPLQPRSGFCQLSASKLCNVSSSDGFRMPARDDGAAHIGAGVTNPDRITRLRDGDGIAESKLVLPPGLHSTFGMALMGSDLYFADTDAVLRLAIRTVQQRLSHLVQKWLIYPVVRSTIIAQTASVSYATVGRRFGKSTRQAGNRAYSLTRNGHGLGTTPFSPGPCSADHSSASTLLSRHRPSAANADRFCSILCPEHIADCHFLSKAKLNSPYLLAL